MFQQVLPSRFIYENIQYEQRKKHSKNVNIIMGKPPNNIRHKSVVLETIIVFFGTIVLL